ncbi:MAG: hypothetical protein MR736_08320 [Prevotella pectinovora]|uniref:hypothetical protein n=1 Tax=Prevotella pectinovora TaxID=1602169 RepID=UPI00243124CF|nr:hypothetical protein [Prevotella pectinovora]MCI6048547.1 hypothetical protein [Prevotella pectinovora]MDD7743488.1 hypothetical protein [Prevotella pectinovora]
MNNLFPTSISPDAAALDILERMPVMEHDDIEDKLAFAISSHGMNDEDINRLCSVLSYRLFIIEKEHEHFLDFTHQYNGLFAVKKKGYVKSVLDCFMRHKKMVLPLITIIQRLAPQLYTSVSSMASSPSADMWAAASAIVCSDCLFERAYPSSVSKFIGLLVRYFGFIEAMIGCTTQLLHEEQCIKNDAGKCLYRMELSMKEAKAYYEPLLKEERLPAFAFLIKENDRLFDEYMAAGDKRQFAQKLFHEVDEAEMRNLAFKVLIAERLACGMTAEERLLFGNDVVKTRQARLLIDHFDSLFLDSASRRDHSLLALMFCKWAIEDNPKASVKSAHRYLLSLYHGHHRLAGYNTVKGNEQKLGTGRHSEPYATFLRSLTDFLLSSGALTDGDGVAAEI